MMMDPALERPQFNVGKLGQTKRFFSLYRYSNLRWKTLSDVERWTLTNVDKNVDFSMKWNAGA